jgi:hypothetical protein
MEGGAVKRVESTESCYIGPEGFKLKIPPANSRLLIEQKSYSTPGPFIEGKTWQTILSSTRRTAAGLRSNKSLKLLHYAHFAT